MIVCLKSDQPIVSVLINNYNYGRFLSEAIDSVLNQTYRNIQTIVVDDGSTDTSKEVIARYGSKINCVFQKNGGQASALNRAWQIAEGDVIFLLDADDTFYPHKIEKCTTFLLKSTEDNLIAASHNLDVIDKHGELSDKILTALLNSKYKNQSNFYNFACKYSYVPFATGPTSSVVIHRKLAERIFPIPEYGVKISADDFIVKTALLIGNVYGLDESLGQYRIHGHNNWATVKKYAHSTDFYNLRSNFLNRKLVENNKQPVISFLDSMGAATYYKKNYPPIAYAGLGLKVFVNHPDPKTLSFLWISIKVTMKNILKKLIGINKPSL